MDWGAFSNAAGGFLGGIFNGTMGFLGQKQANQTNLQIARETNEANRQLAQYEWNKNLEMWNLQNQYNSPASQMRRFKQAGLNPNLIYGQGNAGNATTLPRYSAPTMQPVTVNPAIFQIGNALDVLGKYMDYRIKSAQEEQIRQQTSNMFYQQNTLWPTQNNLWSSQKSYWDANANRITGLLPFEKRNYNSLINTRSDNLSLSRLRYDLDRQRYMYDLDLRNRMWNIQKDYVSEQARDLRLRNNYFENWDIMPNTAFGSRFGAYRLIYGPNFGTDLRNAKTAFKNYLDAELDYMLFRNASEAGGLFGNWFGRGRGLFRRNPNSKRK